MNQGRSSFTKGKEKKQGHRRKTKTSGSYVSSVTYPSHSPWEGLDDSNRCPFEEDTWVLKEKSSKCILYSGKSKIKGVL